MRSYRPYLSGDLSLEGLAATAELVSRRATLADIPSTVVDHAVGRGWVAADGRPTAAALGVCADLLEVAAMETRPGPARTDAFDMTEETR